MASPSARIHAHLVDALTGIPVIHFGDARCPEPYVIVRQSGGDLTNAEVEVECHGKTPAEATLTADRARKALRKANVGGAVPDLRHVSEGYVVPADSKAHALVVLRYNFPVHQDN